MLRTEFLQHQLSEHHSDEKQTCIDWADRNCGQFVYFDGEKAFAALKIEHEDVGHAITQYLQKSNTHPDIIAYIKSNAHHGGFLNLSFLVIRDSLLKRNIQINICKKDHLYKSRYDFIKNEDGSVTFVERLYIEDCKGVEPNSQIIAPIAVTVTKSIIKLVDGKIQHTVFSDRAILTHEAGVNLFDGVDVAVEERFNQQESVNEALDNEISLNVLIGQIKKLNANFNINLAETALIRANALINSEQHYNWKLLQSELAALQNCIYSRSSEKLNREIADAKSKDEEARRGYEQQLNEQGSGVGHGDSFVDDQQASYDDISKKYPNEKMRNKISGILKLDSYKYLVDFNLDMIKKMKHDKQREDIKAIKSEFRNARKSLSDAINVAKNDKDKNELVVGAKKALKLARYYSKNKIIKNQELPEFTKWLNGIAKLVTDPQGNDGISTAYTHCNSYIHEKNTEAAIKLGNKYSWAKCFAGVMILLLGAAVVGLAIAALVSTFASSSPISVPALAVGSALTALGASLLGSKIAAGVILGVAVALGASGVVTGGFFAHRGQKGSVGLIGDEVTKAADKYMENRI